MTTKTPKIQTRLQVRNIPKLAAALGCSEFHLRACLYGRRKPGPELAKKMKEAGLKCQRLRPRTERWV